jgi:hypothetical protein
MAFRGFPEVNNLKMRERFSSAGSVRRGEPEVGGTRQIPVNELGEKEPWKI